MKTIYVGEIPECFGYGISATGETRKQCADALWADFKKARKGYDSLHDLTSLAKVFEYFGGGVYKVTIGKAYFGGFSDDDE